ncbi:MAG: hypothetical protein FJ299_10900 [Planctomycetes bacterium]|nr:hypothetical protein [Planctomycetota bacterium]
MHRTHSPGWFSVHSIDCARATTRTSVVLFAVLSMLAAGCSAPSATLYARGLQVAPDGEFAAADVSGGGSLSATSDTDALDLDDEEVIFAPRADLDWGRVHLIVDHFSSQADGTGTAEAEIEFDGVTIPAGDSVETELDLALTGATLVFDVLPVPNAELSLGFGAVYADLSAEITSLTLTQTASTSEAVPLPVLAARAGVELGRFRLQALARGFDVEIDDVEASYIDLDAFARYDLFGATDSHLRGGIVLGWRHVAVDARFDDGASTIDGDFEYSGPYAGVAFTF